MNTTINLDEYLVTGTSTAYYIPDFVTEDEEEYLIRKVAITMPMPSSQSTQHLPDSRSASTPVEAATKSQVALLLVTLNTECD